MLTVYKYQLLKHGINQVVMPAGATILHLGWQGNKTCIWALVDTNAPSVTRRILMEGTGFSLAEHPGIHIGTLLTANGELVWHYFDQGEATP